MLHWVSAKAGHTTVNCTGRLQMQDPQMHHPFMSTFVYIAAANVMRVDMTAEY